MSFPLTWHPCPHGSGTSAHPEGQPKPRHPKHDMNMKCGEHIPCEQLHIRFPASLFGNVIRGVIPPSRLEKRLRKRLKNVANHESYFCEKGEKCHQKGSVDNPIGLKITTLLADQSGNRQRVRDVMQKSHGSAGRGRWRGMRKLA